MAKVLTIDPWEDDEFVTLGKLTETINAITRGKRVTITIEED